MNKILKYKNIGAGYLFFYIHFVTEVACFFVLSRVVGNIAYLWLFPFIYDTLAFVPQSLIGYFSDKYPKINLGIIGMVLLFIGFMLFNLNILNQYYLGVIILALGNSFIHVNGAEVTLRCSEGKISHAAIFVGGGSFGVITGKLLGASVIPFWIIGIFILTMLPFILLAEYYRRDLKDDKMACKKFDYHNEKINPLVIIGLTVLIVAIRGYAGYGIPTSWNKTIFQSILLYSFMGLGKALGGILVDAFGIRKTAKISIIGSLPLLLFGDKMMFISLLGVMMFSMTMAITLAILVSVLKKKPGLAFGLTTIGLFIGSVPAFFFKFTTVLANDILISILTIICYIMAMSVIKKGDSDG